MTERHSEGNLWYSLPYADLDGEKKHLHYFPQVNFQQWLPRSGAELDVEEHNWCVNKPQIDLQATLNQIN